MKVQMHSTAIYISSIKVLLVQNFSQHITHWTIDAALRGDRKQSYKKLQSLY